MCHRIGLRLALTALVVVLLTGCAAPPTATSPAPTATAVAAPAEPTVAPTDTPVPPTVAPTAAPAASEVQELILATTTSTENSGLLAYLLLGFEAAFQTKVNVIAVGTGQALKLGEDGNADVLLVHARAQEDAFMAAGHGSRREDVMYNDFVIVGPASDPAGIMASTDVVAGFGKIAAAQSPFVSRGDDSGTHAKEKAVWQAAGIEPSGNWYISAGQGMGAVLTMADEQQAYTLSDRATYLARTLEGTDLVIVVEGDPLLFNPYGVIAVNPSKGDHIKADLAAQFIDWLISEPTQAKIAEFGVAEFGAPLFTPDSAAWRAAHPVAATPAADAAGTPALVVSGLVDTQLDLSNEDVLAMPTTEVEYTNKKGETATYTA